MTEYIKAILSNDSFHRINEKMNKHQRKEWNNFRAELYNNLDWVRDRVRGLYIRDDNQQDLNATVNHIIDLVSTMPTFEQ